MYKIKAYRKLRGRIIRKAFDRADNLSEAIIKARKFVERHQCRAVVKCSGEVVETFRFAR